MSKESQLPPTSEDDGGIDAFLRQSATKLPTGDTSDVIQKILDGTLRLSDLLNPDQFTEVERYLTEQYGFDLTDHSFMDQIMKDLFGDSDLGPPTDLPPAP